MISYVQKFKMGPKSAVCRYFHPIALMNNLAACIKHFSLFQMIVEVLKGLDASFILTQRVFNINNDDV